MLSHLLLSTALSLHPTQGNGTAEVLADFRLIGGNSTVESWVRENFGNQTAYEEGYTGGAGRLSGGGRWSGLAAALVVGVVVVEGWM
jgi:hypothetical protein